MTRNGKSYEVEVVKAKNGPKKKFKQTKLEQFESDGNQPTQPLYKPIVENKRKSPRTSLNKEKSDDVICLSLQQKKVIDVIMERKSIFFTGAAGCGKSYVIRLLKLVMEKLKFSNKISFTAPTGVAASNIGGMTIQAWAGIGDTCCIV